MRKQPSGQLKYNSFPGITGTRPKQFSAGLLKITLILFTILSLFSCKNDMEEIRSLEFVDTLTIMRAKDVEVYYSENARVKVEVISPTVLYHAAEEDPYREFPDGFEVLFYDSLMRVKSKISADYGISYEKTGLMEARYNVVVENLQKGEKLQTEELFWDRKKETIHSNKYVKITRGEEVITGEGLVSDQEFENVEIQKTKGLIEVEDEEI